MPRRNMITAPVSSVLALCESPRFLYLVTCIFVLTRVPLLMLDVAPSSDAAWYVARAIGLANGSGYSEGGISTAYWPVGYPAFLAAIFALCGANLFVAKIANLIFAAGTVVLIYRSGKILFRDEAVPRLATLLYVCYPNHAAYTPILLTEILFTFIL